MKKSKPKKKVVVNKKFMMNLANLIYDPKKKSFLRLCDRKLQNGPDPTNEKRPMHCGLGELYFEMTGRQPEVDKVDENDVVELAVDLSTLPDREEVVAEEIDKAKAAIMKLNVPEAMKRHLLDAVCEIDDEDLLGEDAEELFRAALDAIPGENDDGCGHDAEECTIDMFRKRSQRVARQIREAAKYLPE